MCKKYVKVFTSGGKPVWVRLTLSGGGSGVTVEPGRSITFRLDYCFDESAALKPTAGDTLQLYLSDFPDGVFLLPSNMHTSGNTYRDKIITLKFEDVGAYKLIDGVDGWMTVTLYVSGDAAPIEYHPKAVGSGSAENVVKVDKIVVSEPGEGPIPGGGGGNYYNILAKMSEHVLYSDGAGGHIRGDLYQYILPAAPAFINYEVLINFGDGQLWEENHVDDFDYTE